MHVLNHRILVIIEALVVAIVIEIIFDLPQVCELSTRAATYGCASTRDPATVLKSSIAVSPALKVVLAGGAA